MLPPYVVTSYAGHVTLPLKHETTYAGSVMLPPYGEASRAGSASASRLLSRRRRAGGLVGPPGTLRVCSRTDSFFPRRPYASFPCRGLDRSPLPARRRARAGGSGSQGLVAGAPGLLHRPPPTPGAFA